ncbi:MAG: LysM peptidoglycan-binding domain-containing protein [Parachlamydiaceae bacterium]
MTPDPSPFTKKIRHLSLALIFSGVLNIAVLSFLLYWVLRENPPTPYCELKPASYDEQQTPLADQRGCAEILAQLSKLSYSKLVNSLSSVQLIENGYAERDLALACLITFHHFDFQRALPKNAQPQQKRLLTWTPQGQVTPIMLVVYPDLMSEHFDALIHFAKTERWPLTAEGLFLLLKDQKINKRFNEHLVETFLLTSEFWTVELLFNRSGQRVSRQDILDVLLEGDWLTFKQFVDQQRHIHDSSDARRQRFLLDYLAAGSSSAALLLLKIEWEFALKKLDDQQVIAILELMPDNLSEADLFAKEVLISPRGTNVWRKSSEWLYRNSGELMPPQWTHYGALKRFVPEKASLELVSKPIASPAMIAPQISSVHPKATKGSLTKGHSLNECPPMIVVVNQKQNDVKNMKKNEGSGALRAVNPSKPFFYVVQQGDCLWKIAQRFGLTVNEIRSLNHLKSDALKIGMALKLPQPKKIPDTKKT